MLFTHIEMRVREILNATTSHPKFELSLKDDSTQDISSLCYLTVCQFSTLVRPTSLRKSLTSFTQVGRNSEELFLFLNIA